MNRHSSEMDMPGWYMDPQNPDGERFWNGLGWTDLTRAALNLTDYLGPIEPVLERLLGVDDTVAVDLDSGATRDSGVSDEAIVLDLTALSRSSFD